MKKLLVVLCAALLCLSMAACGEPEPTPAPNPGGNDVTDPTGNAGVAYEKLDALFADLQSKVTYTDTATTLDPNMAAMLLGFEPGCDCRLAINDISNLRIGVFACADEAAAETLAEELNGFIANMIETNSSYAPDEVKLLENAAPTVKYNVVILCVTDDAAGVEAVLSDYFA